MLGNMSDRWIQLTVLPVSWKMFITSNVLMIFLSLIRLAALKVWSVKFLQKAKQLSEHGLTAPVTLATCSECVRATRADTLVPNRSVFLPAAHSPQ